MGSPIKDKIRKYLDEQSPDEIKLKILALKIKENYGSVRRYARELVEEGIIVSPKRGWYRSKEVDIIHQIPFERLRLHGIKVEYEGNKINTHVYLPLITSPIMHRHGRNRSVVSHMDYRGREAVITLHKNKIEVWIKSSQNPLDYGEFDGFCGFVEGKFPDIKLHEWALRNVDMNIDVRGLMKEQRFISLQAFKNAWFTIYQKNDDIIRIEERLVLDITLDKALNIFKRMMYSDVEIDIKK